MTKKKKPQQLQQTADTGSDDKLSLPPKPKRNGQAPGVAVELVTNLFRISLKTEKPILCYTIQIDCVDQLTSGDKGGKKGIPRKIPKDLRIQAVRKAISLWSKNNDAGGIGTYVLDGNASTMYALFRMLDDHDGSPGTRSHIEIKAEIESSRIVDKKVAAMKEVLSVKFYSPTPVNVRALVDHCAGQRPRASAEVEHTLKALNTILTGKILVEPGFLGMQAKSGSCSVFPFDKRNQFTISEGVFCNRGFISSVRPTETGLVANVANAVVPFYEPIKIIDLLQRRFHVQDLNRELAPRIIDELKRELRMKQVEAIHINYGSPNKPHYRKYRIHDIGMSTVKEKFDLDDPKTGRKVSTSVFEYFNKEYPTCKLRYPNLPCIIDNKRKIPLEICRLVEKQKVNRRLNPQETSQVIREAAMKPEIHFKTVEQNANLLGKHDKPFKDFGLEINMKPIELTGRELPPIRLLGVVGNRPQPLNTREGGYDNQRVNFFKPASIAKWALVVLADERFVRNFKGPQDLTQACIRFAAGYCRSGASKGIRVAQLDPKDVHIIQVKGQDPDQDVKKKLRDRYCRLNSENFSHAILVLPGIKDWIYSYLQYLEVDVPKKLKKTTQCTRVSCVKDENFVKKLLNGQDRNVSMFLSNLWLKYNTKLGGINHVLDGQQDFSINPQDFQKFLAKGYLFVSIDVCHPAPGDRLEQSVAAAVGLWDITNPNMSSCTRVRVQRKDKSDKEKSTVEQVGEIGIMFEEILDSYRKKSGGSVPTNIVVLRDGVSEGQFEMVLLYELSQIKGRIKNFYDKLKVKAPLLTCLTVQKRHRTRFMRKNPVQSRKGPDYNIQPGTVVDNTVVEPLHHSFYLAPHKAIQGTARAPHVYVIYDEIKFSQDSAQAMIFALSYLSPRCTKGTSIPTPVNLADLAAERGKNIVVSWNEENQQRMSSEERLKALNEFLSTMGDASYQDTLYYV
uniref:Protein argonaute-4 n=1 Tax=Aceria tosichella TaxID=561515 RepID=A0A6G1SIF3_9ACAR